MFTGIITDLGEIRTVEVRGDTRFEIETTYDTDALQIGASVACSGPCLTVVDKGPGWFAVEASGETLRRTTLEEWEVGTKVNLERSMRVGDELGGHIVSGHVDGTAEIVEMVPEGDSMRFAFVGPGHLARYVAAKGSISLDGVSLTVNEVDGSRFTVNVISHTRAVTNFGSRAYGDRVNMEIDTMARYLARLFEKD